MGTDAEAQYQLGLKQFYAGDPIASYAALSKARTLLPAREDIRLAYAAAEHARSVAQEVIPRDKDHDLAIRAAHLARSDQQRNERQIVFVCERIQPRQLRLAKALKTNGFEVIFLYRYATDLDLNAACSKSIQFSDSWDALATAAIMRPIAFHLFSSFADPTMLVFTHHKPGPVVFDYLEIHNGLIFGKPLDLKSLYEKWQPEILANADGICCKDLQYKMAAKRNGWSRHANVLWFPTYPDTSYDRPECATDQPIKMIIAGFIENPDGTLRGVAKLFEALLKAGFALDIYLRPDRNALSPERREAVYANLLALASVQGQITLQNSVDPYTLVQKIKNYDLGIAFGAGALIAQNNDERFLIYSKEHSENGLACRVCDYISAGVVILGMPETRLNRFIGQRYGRWITAELPFNEQDITEIKRAVHSRVPPPKLPASFTIGGNISRLYRFYSHTCARVLNGGRG